MQTHIYML